MDADERDIFNYLKTSGKDFVGVREICRRAASKKRYHEDPEWAVPKLSLMTEHGILERDSMGRFRVKPKPKTKHGGRWISPEIEELLKEKGVSTEPKSSEGERWISPKIAEILKEKGGGKVEGNAHELGTDDEYDQL